MVDQQELQVSQTRDKTTSFHFLTSLPPRLPPQLENTPVLTLECTEEFESDKERTSELLKRVPFDLPSLPLAPSPSLDPLLFYFLELFLSSLLLNYHFTLQHHTILPPLQVANFITQELQNS